MQEVGEAYRAEMDTVKRFLDECCELGVSFRVGSTEIYKAYHRWAEGGGERPMAHVSFSKRMKNRKGIESGHVEGGTVFLGVRVRTEGASEC